MNIPDIFKKECVIGLDIGSSSVKLAQFVEKTDGLHLVRAELKEINASADDAAREKEVLSALSYLFRGVNLKRSKIIASVNCPQTAIRRITTPSMPKSELRQGIMLEAKNYFPFAVDDALMDFEVLEEIETKGVMQYEVLLNVAPRKTIERYISILAKAGIKPYSVVGSSYALERSEWHPKSAPKADKTKEARCLIDIGESHTELVIGVGRMLMFARKVPVTGSDFTKALTNVLTSDRGKTQLSFEEAEKIKREVGIPQELESKIINDKISTAQIRSVLMSPLEQLASEIERCFNYYREDTGGSRISSITLFGGGSSLKGLAGYLSKSLQMDVTVGNSFDGLLMEKSAVREKDNIANRMELAVSAALSEARGINLLPLEIKNEKVITFKRGIIEAAAAGLILTLFLVHIGMGIKLNNIKKRTSVAKAELSGLEPQLRKAEAAVLANEILIDEPRWKDVFMELSNILPNNIYLNNISMQNRFITMRGVVTSEYGEDILSEFVITLEKGIFNNVKLVTSKELPEKQGVEFELKCWVDSAG